MNDADPPAYFPALASYLEAGMDRVEGWLSPTTAAMLAAIAVRQTREGMSADLCEIGVHHGKLFLILAAAAMPGERAVAVDLFEDQQLNIDRSGEGDRTIFERHCADYAPDARIDIIQGSSLDLAGTPFIERRFRLMSIDGGHTAEITANDLRLAERTLLPGGVAALDDILSHHWTGVITGLSAYLQEQGSLVPYALVPNKLFLTTDPDRASAHSAALRTSFPLAWRKTSEMFGHAVEVFDECEYYARGQQRHLHAKLAELTTSLAAAQDQCRDLNARLDAVQDQLTESAKRHAEIGAEMAAILASTSWRVTAPVRLLRRLPLLRG